MKTLHITVENKIANYHDRDGIIVCNNTDYEIEFAFDNEWDGYSTKTARFVWNGSYEDVVFTGNKVTVPVIKNALSVSVGVFSGDLKTTTPAIIGCKKSILCEDGVPSDPSEDVYNQIIELINAGGGTGSGKDGVSPYVIMSQLTNGCLISITDVNGTQSVFIKNGTDGEDGVNGTDGVSPVVSTKSIPGGHRITIRDGYGTQSFDVMDGDDAVVDTSDIERRIKELEEQSHEIVVDVLNDVEISVATASHSASEIWELVNNGVPVVALVNGEYRYYYKRTNLTSDGTPVSVVFSFTEVGEQQDNVTTYGLTIDESKDVLIWYDEFTGTDNSELAGKVLTLEQQMADLLYTAISVTSFGHNAGIREYGETISSVNLSWSINKTPTTLTLDGEALDVADRSKALIGLSVTKDNGKTWRLVATDDRGATSEKTTSISFYNGVYYGAVAEPTTYDSAFVLGLTKELRSNRKPSFSVTSGVGEYIYYCLPTRMGKCAFTLGGFNGGFTLIDTITFTNQSGYSEPYYIYRSDYANLGSPLVTVSGGGG